MVGNDFTALGKCALAFEDENGPGPLSPQPSHGTSCLGHPDGSLVLNFIKVTLVTPITRDMLFLLERQLGVPHYPSPRTSQSSEVGICWGKPRAHRIPPSLAELMYVPFPSDLLHMGSQDSCHTHCSPCSGPETYRGEGGE